MTLVMDWGVVVSAIGVLFLILAGVIKNAISIAASQTRSTENSTKIKELAEDLNDYKLASAVNFVTTTNLKQVEDRLLTAIAAFGASLDRMTDRLDRLLDSKQVPPHE